ncbi:MAG: hypothetical protein U1E97_09450 [Alphaproteobacteria bacterium]
MAEQRIRLLGKARRAPAAFLGRLRKRKRWRDDIDAAFKLIEIGAAVLAHDPLDRLGVGQGQAAAAGDDATGRLNFAPFLRNPFVDGQDQRQHRLDEQRLAVLDRIECVQVARQRGKQEARHRRIARAGRGRDGIKRVAGADEGIENPVGTANDHDPRRIFADAIKPGLILAIDTWRGGQRADGSAKGCR